jgi:hypothetical protein
MKTRRLSISIARSFFFIVITDTIRHVSKGDPYSNIFDDLISRQDYTKILSFDRSCVSTTCKSDAGREIGVADYSDTEMMMKEECNHK